MTVNHLVRVVFLMVRAELSFCVPCEAASDTPLKYKTLKIYFCFHPETKLHSTHHRHSNFTAGDPGELVVEILV